MSEEVGRLARTGLESFAAAWDALRELSVRRAALLSTLAAEERRLVDEVGYLVGAVGKARASAVHEPAALAPVDSLQAIAREAEERLQRARAALQARRDQELSALDAEVALVRERIETLVSRAGAVRPRLELEVARLQGGAAVLVQVQSPSDDDALLLLERLAGVLPTRWGFLRDDAVEELDLPVPLLYPDEGVGAEEARTQEPEALAAILARVGRFAPIRAHLPLPIEADPGLRARLVHRGPVLELQTCRGGAPYSPHVPRDDGELVTAKLLLAKLAGRLELELRFV